MLTKIEQLFKPKRVPLCTALVGVCCWILNHSELSFKIKKGPAHKNNVLRFGHLTFLRDIYLKVGLPMRIIFFLLKWQCVGQFLV